NGQVVELMRFENGFPVYFTIDLNEPAACSVAIFNMMGEKILKEEFSGVSRHQFNLSAFPAGIYLVRVILDDKITTEKIIRQ
ncbi:MAG TPA: T9SS type A sorting domain-containing protein, partial [Bacteroidales bacterium]|nr:T9SS type A sorting domain-containing protein [Bacteroidales bacterium]